MASTAGVAHERRSTSAARRLAQRLLVQELDTATGCTEPAAIAYATCAAARVAGEAARSIALELDTGTYKNALAVGLPATERRGPAAAAAIGAVLADQVPALGLLAHADAPRWQEAERLLDADVVSVEVRPFGRLHVAATVRTDHHVARASLDRRHDRLATLELDGEARWPGPAGAGASVVEDHAIAEALASAEDLVRLTDTLSTDDLQPVRANLEGALALLPEIGADRPDPVALVRHAVGRRMQGAQVAVPTSAGSGNSGLTINLGLWALAPDGGERLARALALAHLTNLAIKARIGRVGALCGGAIASATAVGCAYAWYAGGGAAAVSDVLRAMVDTVAGVVCDGANRACAGKVAAALTVAIDAAGRAVAEPGAYDGDGLGGTTSAEALARLASLAAATGPELDLALVRILEGHDPP